MRNIKTKQKIQKIVSEKSKPKQTIYTISYNYNYLFYFDDYHYVKSVRIRSYSGPHFPAFGLNTERWKIRTRKTLNTDTFHVVYRYYHYATSKTQYGRNWNLGNKNLEKTFFFYLLLLYEVSDLCIYIIDNLLFDHLLNYSFFGSGILG